MGHLESFLDFQYRTIAVLNEKEQTLLVRDQLTGRVLVRRSFPLETAGVYEELKNIRHRNLVQVLEVYRLEDTCVVLEEYVNGCSVADLLIREKRLGVQEAGKLTLAVCRGLFVLHKKNMVCRSVRPDTIRISQDGIVKLTDFSAVREFDRDKPRDTVLIGTEDYAAPEQYGFGQSDERTDIYAVGVLLNVLLTGEWVRMVFEVLQLLVPAAFVFNAWDCSRLSALPKMLRPHFRLIMAGIIWVILDVIKSLCT